MQLPGLWFPEVQVINAVEIHVLSVPSKSGFPHAKVEVGCVYSLYSNTTFMLHGVKDGIQMPYIPFLDILHKTRKKKQWLHSLQSSQTKSETKKKKKKIQIAYKRLLTGS